VGGIIRSVDNALSGVNSALSNLVDAAGQTSASITKKSRDIDGSIDEIIKNYIKFVGSVKNVLGSTEKISKPAVSSLQAVLKSSSIVTYKSMDNVSNNLKKKSQLDTPKFKKVKKIFRDNLLGIDLKLPDLSKILNVDSIVKDLKKCSAGTDVDVEVIKDSLGDAKGKVDVVIKAVSTSPPEDDGDWQSLFDDLLSSCSKSFDATAYVIEHATKKTPEVNEKINQVVMDVLFAIQDLIAAARLTSRGNGEKVEPAIIGIAQAIQGMLVALKSVTKPNVLASNTLTSIQLSVQSVIKIVLDVFFALEKTIKKYVTSASVLPALTTHLKTAKTAPPATLVNMIPSINNIVGSKKLV